MHTFNRDRFRKKLRKLLSRADNEQFFQLVWATDALQSDRLDVASRYLTFPSEAVNSAPCSKYAIHQWELETLVCQLLLTEKDIPTNGRIRQLNCTSFAAIAEATNHLRSLEDAESGIYLGRFHVLNELHRLGQRQFAWQQGFASAAQFYRYSLLYGQGQCADYFARTYGLTFNEFSLVGFGFCAGLLSQPFLTKKYEMVSLGISDDVRDAALKLLLIPIADAIKKMKEMFSGSLPTAYQPSVIRQYPLIGFGSQGERMRAPLIDLIMLRITAGVYYDLVSGPASLRNDASERFERYCADFVVATMPKMGVSRSFAYRFLGNLIHTPDILLKKGAEVAVAIECKATKLTYAAKFSEDPSREAEIGYNEISKGIYQLWRYFSHVRRGLVTGHSLSLDACGVVVTLDAWLVASKDLQREVMDLAKGLAKKNNYILPEDCRGVLFCPVHDFEWILARADEERFLYTLAQAQDDKYIGWALRNIFEDLFPGEHRAKSFPFDVGSVLPWWKLVEESRSAKTLHLK